MIEPGKINNLKAGRVTPHGVYMTDDEGREVLLPKKFIPGDLRVNDMLDVFVFYDSEDRLTATTQTPKIELNTFACLKVKDVSRVGAFLDWGLEKDLLVPFREQQPKMESGKKYIVYLYLDKQTDRLVATARIYKYLSNENIDLEEGDEVDLLIADTTDLGVNVIVNGRHNGLIFKEDIFRSLQYGEFCKGFVKNIRLDKKLDLTLQKPGYSGIEPVAQKILAQLKKKGGFLALNDKSSPNEISVVFGISKKVFKKAIGTLYQKKLIRIENDGIHLLK